MKILVGFIFNVSRSVIKNFFNFLLISFFFTTISFAQLPPASSLATEMEIGWNLGNALEALGGETAWRNPKVNQQLINAVCDAGFNTIRIPCSWDSHANQSTLKIDDAWLARVREVIDYCYNKNMYVIINIHWDGGWLENNVTSDMQNTVNIKQNAYWEQIAEYFKDYDEHLLFASANEPNVEANDTTQMNVLMSYHQTFVNAVRASGGNNSSRVLIIQGPSTDIEKTFNGMNSLPKDIIENRLMLEIHYYTPWNFCGLETDESWGKMFYFWGKEYHSKTNTDRNSKWGEESSADSLFDKMKIKFIDKGIPVILGEYGVIKRTNLTGKDLDLHLKSRKYFNNYINKSAIKHGLIPIYWDNGNHTKNGFAIFDRKTGEVLDKDLLDAIITGAKSMRLQNND